jgi:hypothetical protein
MNKYFAALLVSLLGFCILGAVGYIIMLPEAGNEELVDSDTHKIILFVLGSTLWSACQIAAILCLIGFTPALPQTNTSET